MAQLTLQHIKGNTYYIPSPTNIGIYAENNEAILIDSGNDKEAGRQILRLLNEQEWQLKLIINTHSNADHIGGNAYLQEKTGCRIATSRMEAAFINDPVLESSFLYGGFPNRDMRNKFLMAKPSNVTNLIKSSGDIEGTGLRAVSLPGHFFDMLGVVTPDNIFFIADSLVPENIMNKYHLCFLWDIKSHFDTLDMLCNEKADLFVPSHGVPTTNLTPLVEKNKEKINEILARIHNFCINGATTEEVLREICILYGITLNATQYVLVTSTIRSYLSYLYEDGSLDCLFDDGRMIWKRKY